MTVHWPEVRDDRRAATAPGRTVTPPTGSSSPPLEADTRVPGDAAAGTDPGTDAGTDAGVDAGAAVAIGPPAAGRPRPVAPGALLVLGVALLVVAVVQADRTTSGGVLGLIEVLPVAWWLAVAAVSVGFVRLLVAAPRRHVWLGAHLVVMIVALHAVPGLIEPHARFPTAWTHVGFVDHIVETGQVDPGYDARYNWPGAFSFGALLVEVTGAESARDLLRFAPLVVNLLLLAPLSLIVRHVTRDPRVRWVALWLAVITGWVGQDYLAPQALAMLGYLTVVGVLLRWFRRPAGGAASRVDLVAAARRRWPGSTGDRDLAGFTTPSPPAGPGQRLGLVVVIAGLGAALAFSHQLTPIILPAAVTVLVVVGRVDRPVVPLLLGVCAAGWLMFGTTSYLESNLVELTSGVGDLGAVVGDNVESRTSPDPLRQLVLGTRLALTAGVGLAALVGAARQWRRGRLDWGLLGMAAAPIALLVLNSYGGEMILRVSLFSLPFLAVLAAFGLVGEGERARSRRTARLSGAAVLVATVLVVPAFVVARYGNEAFERIESSDIAAWDHLATRALPGSIVVVPDFAGPWRYRGLMDFDYRVYADLAPGMPDADGLDDLLGDGTSGATDGVFGDGPADAYLVLGAASARYGEIAEGYPDGWHDDLAAELLADGEWVVAFRSGDTLVLRRPAEVVSP